MIVTSEHDGDVYAHRAMLMDVMTSRLRQRERPEPRRVEPRRTRTPAIYRGADAPITSADHVEGRAFIRWRYVSGFVVVCLLIVLAVFFISDSFYIHRIAVTGLEAMTLDEVYQLTGIADTHLFWVDPVEVRRNLLTSPTIADAQVVVSWNAPLVQVLIQEREPALLWQQGENSQWLDLQGRIMQQRGVRSDLLVVTAEGEPSDDDVSAQTVNGALQIRALLSGVTQLRYSTATGLGYDDPRGWQVWFGDGDDIPEKILIYNAIVEDLQARAIQPRLINVSNPDAPYYNAPGR
jgi:cell division septal protein FtsQ